MKIAAVITEYNPFHNGHLYQLKTIRNELDADFIIIVMSGNFMQRGIPAIVDKYERCQIALENGADIVFELPVYFALGSAEYFAKGAVSLIDKLGVVDFLHFGSESGDINSIKKCAEIMADEPLEYKALLNKYLKGGNSFPLARSLAVNEYFSNKYTDISADEIYSNSNNILGLEYIKALIQRKSHITPLTLKRNGGGYNSSSIDADSFASANAIRNFLMSENGNDIDLIKEHVPVSVLESLKKYTVGNDCFIFQNDFSEILLYRLLQACNHNDKNALAKYYDIRAPLSNTIINSIMNYSSFSDFAMLCKSKNLTYTRICRGLMHVLLDMTQENADILKNDDYSQYARLLGFNNNGKELLKHIKNNTSIPIVTKPSKALKELKNSALMSFEADIHAANIYEAVKQQKSGQGFIKNEFTREIKRLP